MIRKIIHLNYKKLQIAGAGFGALTGLILLLGVSQFYIDMDHVMKSNRDLIDPEYIVINKKISFLETFNLASATFSKDEIDEIRQQPFAEKVVGFISNQFALSAYTESSRFPDFYTDLFFEAVPDAYLDVKNQEWHWEKGQRTIPIILPQDYLNLYNFGFATSQGLPQISPRAISLVNFKIEIEGLGKKDIFNGKIIGFSNRLNSILVPYTFLTWANREYGNTSKPEISRLVIVTKDPTDPKIVSFLDKKGYETIREKLKSSRLNIILKLIISFLGTLGFLIIFLAFMVFILSFQLLIARSEDRIRKLKWLGYHYREISRPFIADLGIIMGILVIVTAVLLVLIKNRFSEYVSGWGLELSKGISPLIAWGGGALVLLMFVLNVAAILRQTRKVPIDKQDHSRGLILTSTPSTPFMRSSNLLVSVLP